MRSPELRYSIFVVPKDTVIEVKGKVRGAVKGRKRNRVLVLKRVAQSIIEARRGKHPTHVFAHRKRALQTMSNTAWQNGRRKAGKEEPYLADLRVHESAARGRNAIAGGQCAREHHCGHPLT